MQAPKRRHPTEGWNSSLKSSNSKETIDWRDAAKEVFGDMPSPALNLRGLRNREGLTQKQLGEAIGVEQSNISKMERARRQISPKIAKRIEEIFDTDYRLFKA